MANWAESICLKCGQKMETYFCAVFTQPSWLDDYPVQVRWSIREIEKVS